MDVIRYNYDTKSFSIVELKLFSRNDNDRPKHNKKWNVVGGNVPQNLRNEFSQKRIKNWGEFKGWCQRHNLTPDENSGGYGQNNNNNNNNNQNNYDNTNTSGPTKGEGSGIYNYGHRFEDNFKMGKMNARKYTTVRLLKERLNELLEDGTIDDVAEDGNYNYVIRIKKTTGTGEKSKGPNYIYIGIYVIDDNTYGLVRWDVKKGGNYVDGVKNATIAGPDNLRQVIKKIKEGEKTIWEVAKDKLAHTPKTVIGELGGWLLKLAANSIGFVADQLKKWGESR